ncbi:cellulase family glycosylhydrolase [Actinomadura alba]|uniref:Endoglucanase n=1 Tax=Actinomadura alba TaxID=406431 RepID=A0ABR7LRF2_9ACTN|nr:cellulase family glycosylhydrolase [Actinomadura alba]MBC6467417.1 cellulase family glycosylhydrolase [Actinomadura alba]
MKSRLAVAGTTLLALLFSMFVSVQPAHAAVGLRVSGGRVVEANGNAFVMRGVSHPHAWYAGQTGSFADIKSLGANTVRVVLSGGRWTANTASDVANVISLCKQNRLICVLENHDTTGYGEQSGAYTLDQAVDYWIGLQSVLTGQENHVIINIGNEPFGNNSVTPGWQAATTSAITRLRNAGFQHLIMVDAPNWGQDWAFTMRDNAAAVFDSDPQRNIVFSIHMYGVFDTAAEVTDYLNRFQTAGLPLVVGEFGHDHSDGNPDEDTIMSQAQSRGLGYIGWSWSGNGGGVEYLDMVTNFNVGSLTSWGQRIFNGANGIRQTAREATIYGGSSADTTPPTAPGTPAATNVTSTGATLSWAVSTDSGGSGLAGYDVYREQGSTDPQLGQSTTNSITLTGLTASTQYQVYVRARDGAGNLSANSSAVTFTTASGGGGGACRVAFSASPWGSGQGGFTAYVTITNTGTSAVNGWSLAFALPSGHGFQQGWSATWASSGQNLTATNLSWNGGLAANGGSTQIGFNGTWSGTFTRPASFTLNGSACTVA